MTSSAASESTGTDSLGNVFRLVSKNCAICGEKNVRSLGMRGGRYQRARQGLAAEVVECRECGLMWSDPFPIPVNPSELYGDPSKYFGDESDEGQVAYFQTLIRRAVELTGKATPSILDVGSGRGPMLRAAKLEGCTDAIGLELVRGMYEHSRRLGLNILLETVETYAEHASRTFDFVCLSAIIEHVYDPGAMLAAVAKLTHPGSVVFIDAPNERSLLGFLLNAAYRLRGSRAVVHLAPTWAPFHVWGFSEKPLTKLLNRHAFDVVSVLKYSELGFVNQRGLRGAVLKAGAKALAAVANRTGTASNIYIWAKRR